MHLEQLVDALPTDEEKSIKIIRFMLDNDVLGYDDGGRLVWIGERK
jgi:hypothetical protein